MWDYSGSIWSLAGGSLVHKSLAVIYQETLKAWLVGGEGNGDGWLGER